MRRRRRSPVRRPRGRAAQLGYPGTRTLVSPSGGLYEIGEPAGYTPGDAVPFLLFCHAAGGDQHLSGNPDAAAAQANGYLVGACLADLARNWGNPGAIDDYVDLFHLVAAQYRITRTVLWAASMGGLAAFTLAGSGRIPGLKGVLAMYPVCSLANNYADNINGYRAEVDTAFGITGSSPFTYAERTAGYDPCLRPAAAYNNLRFQLYHSSGDTIVPKARHSDVLMALLSGATEATLTPTTGEHGDASNWGFSNYSAFLARCV